MLKNEIADIKIHDGMHHGFYRAVVEDIEDPLSSGRVRVRIWGLHSQNTTKSATDGVPTDELPWAEPMIPIVEGGINQKGLFGVPQVNSHVLVIFENGNPLKPIYVGSLPGGNGDWNSGGGAVGKVSIFVTAAGHFRLDSTDGAKEVEMKHTNGSKVLLKDDGTIEVNATKDHDVIISGDSNVTISGQASVTATGNITITSSGLITISGTQVAIN